MAMDRVGAVISQEFLPGDVLLSRKLLVNEFARDAEGGVRVIGQSLSAPETDIGRANWSRCGEYSAVSLKHGKGHVLVGKPPEGGESNHAVATDDNQATKSVPNTGKTVEGTLRPNSVFDAEMTTIYPNMNAIAVERYDPVARHDQIVGLRQLRYGLCSCHWNYLRWWSGSVGCANSRRARFVSE